MLTDADANDIELPEPPFDWQQVAQDCATDAVAAGQLPAHANVAQITTMLIDATMGILAAERRSSGRMDTRAKLYRMWRALLTGVGAADVSAIIADTIVVAPLGSEINRLTAPEA